MSAEKSEANEIEASIAAALARLRGKADDDSEAMKAINDAFHSLRDQVEALMGQLPDKSETTAMAAGRRGLASADDMVLFMQRRAKASADLEPPSPPTQIERDPPEGDEFINEIVKRLGGRQVWPKAKTPTTRLEVHEAIQRGIPGRALGFVLDHVTEIPSDKLLDVIGISQRTVQRRAGAPEVPLSQDQGGRLWKFAEILTAAIGLFGDRKSAERWLDSPAIALEQNAPVDLMTTQTGTELVEQLLTRLEHGVYT